MRWLFLLVLAAGCGKPTHECVRSHEETQLMFVPDGSGGMMLLPYSTNVCDEWRKLEEKSK